MFLCHAYAHVACVCIFMEELPFSPLLKIAGCSLQRTFHSASFHITLHPILISHLFLAASSNNLVQTSCVQLLGRSEIKALRCINSVCIAQLPIQQLINSIDFSRYAPR